MNLCLQMTWRQTESILESDNEKTMKKRGHLAKINAEYLILDKQDWKIMAPEKMILWPNAWTW